MAEVTACKRLSHPNIIRVVDHSALESDEANEEKMYLVMPYMASGDLSKRAGLYKDSLDSTLQVAAALAQGLAHAHGHGVIHRDVKPANILFAEDNHDPVLSDFGICLLRDEPRATETGEVVGPREFMAPELAGGGKLEATAAADVYSLGKVIYFMLSGGTILPRERLAEAEYDIFSGKGTRYVLLANLLHRMICGVESRLQSMANVNEELARIRDWEKRQGSILSPRASALLAGIVSNQRTTQSVEEHNRQISEAEEARLAVYRETLRDWFDERVNGLVETLSHNGVAQARPLTDKEVQETMSECGAIKPYGPNTAIPAPLTVARGLEFTLPSASWKQIHRLVLAAYSTRKIVVARPSKSGKREMSDQTVLFAPYYYAGKNSQAFFAARRQQQSPWERFTKQFDRDQTLYLETSISRWPGDADEFKATLDSVTELFLEHIGSSSANSSGALF